MQKKSSGITPASSLSYQLGITPYSLMTCVLPLASPRMPSFEELVRQDREGQSLEVSALPGQSGDLYRELLRDEPEEIYQDSLKHPEKYDEEQVSLLSSLVSSPREPTPGERRVLLRSVDSWLRSPEAKTLPRAPSKIPSPGKKPPPSPPPPPAFSEGEGEDHPDKGAFDWLR